MANSGGFTAISSEQMREIVRKYIARCGTLAAAADRLSTTQSHLSNILAGNRSVGDHIAAQLGYTAVKEQRCVSVIYYLGANSD